MTCDGVMIEHVDFSPQNLLTVTLNEVTLNENHPSQPSLLKHKRPMRTQLKAPTLMSAQWKS
ncbi:hypothetical protein OYC64_003934 [Pagothenia borchgrevinki]|uniref:Uncharacterized protein n=1 Tax=Pagothenia borchgrevinki TaxID=8213 RepID=A0ABD2FQX4_PAGBO